jgi:hypothetical protein
MTGPRFEVVQRVTADLVRSIIGITEAHDSTLSEDVSAAAVALVSFIRSVTANEADFVACVDQVAEQMSYAVRDPNIRLVRLEIGAKQ